MSEFCHRCGGELPAGSGESPFCPHCGTPQLRLSLDYQSVETGGEQVDAATAGPTTGALPPPRPRQVDWKTAIGCAAAVALVAGVLSAIALRVDVLSLPSLMWIMSGSLITLGLYQRRRPAAWMDVGIGARIGVVVGICMALGLAVSLAGAGLVARFGLHTMGTFDAQMTDQIVKVQVALQKAPTPPTPETIGLVNSPEFRAGLMLLNFAFASAALLVLSTLGGAFAGLLRTRRRSAA